MRKSPPEGNQRKAYQVPLNEQGKIETRNRATGVRIWILDNFQLTVIRWLCRCHRVVECKASTNFTSTNSWKPRQWSEKAKARMFKLNQHLSYWINEQRKEWSRNAHQGKKFKACQNLIKPQEPEMISLTKQRLKQLLQKVIAAKDLKDYQLSTAMYTRWEIQILIQDAEPRAE